MAKQNIKNFKLEQEELKPMTIGVFESRKKSSVGIFIILSIFILLVLFLPQLSTQFNKYFGKEPDLPNPGGAVDPIVPPDPDSDDEDDFYSTFYDFGTDLKIDRDDISIGSFEISNENILSFNIINNADSDITLTNLNYYLELYNEDHTLLERIKLVGGTIDVNSSRDYDRELNFSDTSQIAAVVFAKLEAKDYTPININNDADGKGSLVCSRPHEKVTYNFVNNKLKDITSEISYTQADVDYAEVYQRYSNQSTIYNGRPGIASTFLQYNDTFSVSTTVDLSEANRTTIYNADSFSLDTEAKVVNFEMEAQGFDCD